MQYYFEAIKNQQDYSRVLEQALVRFALIVREELIKSPMIKGVETFLRQCLQKQIPYFVNSGGDQQELREVFAERDIDQFFSMIIESPETKKQNLEKLITQDQLPSPSLFWGDTYSDYLAAKAYNMDFLYVSAVSAVSAVSEWQDGIQFCSNNKILMMNCSCNL